MSSADNLPLVPGSRIYIVDQTIVGLPRLETNEVAKIDEKNVTYRFPSAHGVIGCKAGWVYVEVDNALKRFKEALSEE